MTVKAAPAKVNERAIAAFVRKGGAPSAEAATSQTKGVLLNVPLGLLEKVDIAVEARPIPTPRHTWILEAMVEKLERK